MGKCPVKQDGATQFNGVADDSLFTYLPVDLRVSMGFPMIAKLGVGIVVISIGAVIIAIWLITRRIIRRQKEVSL